MLIVADAARRAGLSYDDLEADRAALRDALEATEIDTPLGPFRFTPDHDVIQPIWIQAMDGAGGFHLIKTIESTAARKEG